MIAFYRKLNFHETARIIKSTPNKKAIYHDMIDSAFSFSIIIFLIAFCLKNAFEEPVEIKFLIRHSERMQINSRKLASNILFFMVNTSEYFINFSTDYSTPIPSIALFSEFNSNFLIYFHAKRKENTTYFAFIQVQIILKLRYYSTK